jgi:hypothetical protein
VNRYAAPKADVADRLLSDSEPFSGNKRWVVFLFVLLGPAIAAVPFSVALSMSRANWGQFLAPFLWAYLFAGLAPLVAAFLFMRLARVTTSAVQRSVRVAFFGLGAASGGLASAAWIIAIGTLLSREALNLSGLPLVAIIAVLGAFSGGVCGLVAIRLRTDNGT